MKKTPLVILAVILIHAALPLGAYTVYLKDGAKLIAKEPPEIRGEVAIITLQNGTQSSIAASEIDLDRTREANQNELGSALILEGGEFTDQPTSAEPEKEERLSDLISRNRTRVAARRQAPNTGSAIQIGSAEQIDLLTWQRSPYRNLDIASEIQSVFRGQGVEQIRLYQGTSGDHVLIDLTTDSEAAVFRGLKVAATALVHLQGTFPGSVGAMELSLTTSSRTRAGQFVLDADAAAQLADGSIEPSTYYVQNVKF
jgi:hypothetical protein